MIDQNEAKRIAGVRAIEEFVRDGMTLGLGSGTTSHFFVRELGKRVAAGLTIDGPDEIDHELNMIKGGGACLLWEKIVAHASKRMITICDETKIVERLGGFPLPVEIVQFAWKQTERRVVEALREHGVDAPTVERRMSDGQPVITDSGHFIVDCRCGLLDAPARLEQHLNAIPGVVENGLFTRESDGMVVGALDGTSRVQLRAARSPSGQG